jgi:hypothetical protein
VNRRIFFSAISSSIFVAALYAPPIFAGLRDVQVFEVRRNLQMKEDEAVLHDYYINAGADEGLKPGMTLQVFRRLPVHDSFGRASNEDMVVSIATLKLIHVQKAVSIGRKLADRQGAVPVLDFGNVMSGDRVDLGTAAAPAEGGIGKGHPVERVGARFEVQVKDSASATKKPEAEAVKSEAPSTEKLPEKSAEKAPAQVAPVGATTAPGAPAPSNQAASAKSSDQGPTILTK